MIRLIAVKLLRLVPVLFVVSLGTFFLLELVPGDPAITLLGDSVTPERYEEVREELGLNDPIYTRYISWMSNILTGDFGEQLTRPGFEVSERIQQHLPITLQITIMGMAMALIVSIPMGLWTAYRQNQRIDKISSGMAFGVISIPSFLAGLLLIFFFVFHQDVPRYIVLIGGILGAVVLFRQFLTKSTLARNRKSSKKSQHKNSQLDPAPVTAPVTEPIADLVPERSTQTPKLIGASLLLGAALLLFFWWPDFPRQGFSRITSEDGIVENLRSAFLPSLTVALAEVAVFMRLLRSDMISTLREDFILSARAKGMPMYRVLFTHALRPSSFSLITLAGVAFGRLIGGTVIVEEIFNLPGMGKLIVGEGVTRLDYTIVQGAVLVLATFYVLLNVAIDISYVYLDPRIRRGAALARTQT